jgi:D-alanyl-D-alanine carboxypeptidase (penicillin-binding protein 4)
MNRSILSTPKFLLLLALSLFRLNAQELPAPSSLAELRDTLEKHLAQPKFSAAIWGVKIQSLDTGKLIFEHNPQKLFSPASNSKLYTVAWRLIDSARIIA